jgi:hypothetical protein
LLHTKKGERRGTFASSRTPSHAGFVSPALDAFSSAASGVECQSSGTSSAVSLVGAPKNWVSPLFFFWRGERTGCASVPSFHSPRRAVQAPSRNEAALVRLDSLSCAPVGRG